MTHEAYKELLAASALSALDGEDARSLELHLEQCDDCRRELLDCQETAALIALSTKPVEPSAAIRQTVLTSVHREAGRRERDDAGAVGTKAAALVLPFAQSRGSGRRYYGSFGTIAASLVFVASLIALFTVWQQNRSAKAELARLKTEMSRTNDQLARERAVVALLTSPGARMTELAGTEVARDARAMLAYDKTGHAMLMAKGLPAAPNGMAYQLWFIKDSKKMPGRVFKTDSSGNGTLEDQIPTSAMDSAVFAITLEPESGVKVPTGAIYLVSSSS
jgi:hypothetical protein